MLNARASSIANTTLPPRWIYFPALPGVLIRHSETIVQFAKPIENEVAQAASNSTESARIKILVPIRVG